MVSRIYYILIILLLNVNNILSCDCDSLGIEIAIKNADVIFIGKTLDVVNNSNIPYYSQELGYSVIQIEKVYKGEQKLSSGYKIPIFNFKSSCDFIFEKDSTYLIFGIYPKNGRFIYTNKCLYTRNINKVDLQELKFLKKQIINDYKDNEEFIKIE